MATVLLVTYNSRSSVEAIAALLTAWTRTSPAHTAVVVDNNSQDGSGDALREGMRDAARVRFVQNTFNCGFAPAVNQAFRVSVDAFGPPDFVVLINPDVDATPAAIEACLSTAHSANAGILSPLLVDAAGHHDRGAARRDWNLRRLFVEIGGAPRAARLLGTQARSLPVVAGTGCQVSDMTSGAFMVIRADVFGAGLDDALPMYLEDQEVCIRARQMHQQVLVNTDVTIVHRGAESRLSAVAGQRDLRLMELAAAPVAALQLSGSGSLTSARFAIASGAIVRLVAATLAYLLAMLSRRRRDWARSQIQLARWLLDWAANPHMELSLPH